MTHKRIFSYDSSFVNQSSRLAIKTTIERGAALYDRERHLSALVRLGPLSLLPASPVQDAPAQKSPEQGAQAQSRHVLRALAQALLAQRSLGRAGHWTYDLNRHIALRQAFLAEARNLRAIRGSSRAEN